MSDTDANSDDTWSSDAESDDLDTVNSSEIRFDACCKD
jgi:hypothetical protein